MEGQTNVLVPQPVHCIRRLSAPGNSALCFSVDVVQRDEMDTRWQLIVAFAVYFQNFTDADGFTLSKNKKNILTSEYVT